MCGGIGMLGLADLLADDAFAAGTHTVWPALRAESEARHPAVHDRRAVAGRSVGSEAGADEVRRAAAGDGRSAHRAHDRRADADEVRVREARQGRHRDERAAAEPRHCGRRAVRHPLDVHDQPEPRAGAQHVPSGEHDPVAAVDGLVDSYGLGTENKNLPGVHGAGAGRRRLHDRGIPARRVPGHVVQHLRDRARTR